MNITIFPPKCVFCDCLVNNEKFKICSECIEKISYNINRCMVCGKPLDTVYGEKICIRCRKIHRPFVRAFVPLVYKDAVRKSIHKFKFCARPSFAQTYAALIFIEIKKTGYIPDAVTYVPVHFARLGNRGYNQSALVARALAQLLGVECIKTLKKIKNTQPLYKLSAAMRVNEVSGAFAYHKKAEIKGLRLLLVDDIITTGTTVGECSRILKKAGAFEISAAAIAAVE